MSDVVMPRLSDSMEEGTILEWLIADGDEVAVGEPLAEIETDKANMAYEADATGLLEQLARPGETLAVGALIARITEPGEGAHNGEQTAQANGGGAGSSLSGPEPAAAAPSEHPPPGGGGRAKASPLARRIAAGNEIDLGAIAGSGVGGRVVKADVVQALAWGSTPDAVVPPSPAQARGSAPASSPAQAGSRSSLDTRETPPASLPAPAGSFPGEGRETATVPAPASGSASTKPPPPLGGRSASSPAQAGDNTSPPMHGETPPAHPASTPAGPLPASEKPETAKGTVETADLTKLQQTVARRMAESKATAPHFYLQAEVDMSRCFEARAQLKAAAGEGDVIPSFNDMVVKACAIALREFPRANGAYRDGRFEQYSRVNVGIAVAAQDALVVPTVFDADLKGLRRIAAESRSLAQRVRDGSVTPPELSGGTFTVSNLGVYGITNFHAVINAPQAAILAVGAIRETAVVRDGELMPGRLMGVTLACDHRILYGADGAEFLARIRTLLEEPLGLAL